MWVDFKINSQWCKQAVYTKTCCIYVPVKEEAFYIVEKDAEVANIETSGAICKSYRETDMMVSLDIVRV